MKNEKYVPYGCLTVVIFIFIFFVIMMSTLSCTTSEQLTVPNYNDRVIVGYSKNMKRYKVVDGYGNWAEPIKIESPDTLKIGDIMPADGYYRLCRN